MSESRNTNDHRGPASRGTARLAFAFGTALVGVLYLAVAITPLAAGRIEVGATRTDIDTIERDGFPDASYLEVVGGNVVFRYASAWLSPREGQGRLYKLTAPVVSSSELEAWRQSRQEGQALDLSRLRLVAAFDRETVAKLWPEVARRAEAEQPLDVEAVPLALRGETVVAKGQLSLPSFPRPGSTNLYWESVRHLRHGVHHDSLGNLLKNFAIAAALLTASFLTFRYHRRHPTRSPPAGLDLTPLTDGTLDLD